jgi:Holliday junction resolvasome RuvABC ATP-dependent DNA helicase subunit
MLTIVGLVQINYNVVNAMTSDAVIPLKPNSSTRFTGRTDVIAKLKEHFTSPSDGVRTRKYFLLHGMGGIGKTQICLRFVEEMSDQ